MNFQRSKNIYVPNSPCSDDQFACQVESWLQQSTYLANDANTSFITVDLLYDCIESLKLLKAAGHDGVTSEHIVFGGNDLGCLKKHGRHGQGVFFLLPSIQKIWRMMCASINGPGTRFSKGGKSRGGAYLQE